MTANIAYLIQGKLHLKLGEKTTLIESEFAKSVQQRVREVQRRQFFRNRGVMANFMPPQMLRSAEQQEDPPAPILITSLCRGSDQKFFYSLEVGNVAGIFAFDLQKNQEQRLFHGPDFRVHCLNFNPNQNLIACSTFHKDGSANIALLPLDSSILKEVTEGDSLDLAPHWLPGAGKALIFQSAGLGRNAQGLIVEKGPFTLEKLDFDRQEVITLAADSAYDLLGGQMTADGTLYYIRRPYKSLRNSFNILKLLQDILLIPIRLIYAIYQWLNFFTWRYTGKPLGTAGGPQAPDIKTQMTAWGEIIDIPKVTKNNVVGDPDATALVPKTWQLVRQKTGHDLELVQEGVLSFDLQEDGSILYTNGSGIYWIKSDGSQERTLTATLIEQAIILSGELRE